MYDDKNIFSAKTQSYGRVMTQKRVKNQANEKPTKSAKKY
jgi:hypothetical protein